MTSDDRMTWGLIIDVLDVLERHGYHRHDPQHTGHAVEVISYLARTYEGTREIPYGTHPGQAQPPGTTPPAAEADQDAVILTDTEVSTVRAALELAADATRARATLCTSCPDRSCLTCQSRLQDAQTYDQMATEIIQAAQASAAATTRPPGHDQARPAPGKEAGQ
jgi:Xaa-Pro aminopeptidase